MSCSARIGAFAAVSLVLLRLATGWHFFQEGTNKLNDPNWSSAGFLLQAKGPLADFYHSQVPQAHDWQKLLEVPQETGFLDEEQIARRREWQEAYEKEVLAAREAGEPEPFKIAEYKPYSQWATRIVDDWQDTLERFFDLPHLTEEHKERASAALDEARLQLVNYLEGVEPEISEYQHELYRIEQMRKQGATGELAYHDERIQAKEAEAAQMAQPWLAEVSAIEESFQGALRQIYRDAQQAHEAERAAAAARAESAEDADEDTDADEQPASDPVEPNAEAAADVVQEVAGAAPEAAGTEAAPEQDGLPPDPDVMELLEVEAQSPAEEAAAAPGAEAPGEEVASEEAANEEETVNEEVVNEEESDEPQAAGEAEDAESDVATEGAEEEPLTLEDVLTDSRRAELEQVDKVVTWSHVIIGACLVVGLFTPLAALGGAVFLAMVISTQPPWVPGTQDTYYQFVEMFSLLVLAATCAGRWAGLDYFFTLLFCRNDRS